ncbi:uncharacterized protein B0J16DRAFT_61622 [Fusarium flagelliforme]|uniref:Uncharacterized protein n=1 Tax=Fusarium flagelliforme TaxID=2675880 RepID=A0A395M7X5_9HYPO|nr:uncharacterized protein B0J16DRAFT_61622 [Fusarium flagelliforme]KAH7192513.1 hypothetical protein B0J16DRAFT_61622 [Fusarium flagelliforme]RFN43971.1 hypothetical protein FIE12Z_11781 [Fusarium flagelliforme]
MEHSTNRGNTPLDDPPPPYSDAPPATSAAGNTARPFSSGPPPEALVQECASSSYVPISQTLTANYQLAYRTFHLGNESNNKIFATSVYAGTTGAGPGRYSILLHNGPSAKDKTLAAAGAVDKSSSSALEFKTLINISPLPGQENVMMTKNAAVAMENMSARVLPDGQTVAFLFSVFTNHTADDVGKGKMADVGPRREQFEWRMIPKSEIGDKDYAHEYKLFRVPVSSTAEGSATATANEPVAVTSFKRLLSLSKPFKLHFLDVQTPDAPNERWRLMALITALRIWQHEQASFYSSTAMLDGASKCT